MFQLLETIKVVNGKLLQLKYHNDRVNRSRNILLGRNDLWNLAQMIDIPDLDPGGIYRCRFLYAEKPEMIEFIPYVRRRISKLYIVHADMLDYSFKYANRGNLELLKKSLPESEHSDIIIVKNGFITDTSFANIVFYDGSDWFTPSVPLLKGTKRQFYLDSRKIREKEIKPADLHQYRMARLINAMIDLEESEDIPIENILF
jgi:4-amino-4-deoxychorismate lyase